MDQSGSSYHERQQYCPLENVSAAIQSLDTVRALHQTVVSLRSALEEAHKEIDNLKKDITIGTDIVNGKIYREQYINDEVLKENSQLQQKPLQLLPTIQNSSLSISTSALSRKTIPSKILQSKNINEEKQLEDDATLNKQSDSIVTFSNQKNVNKTTANSSAITTTTPTTNEKIYELHDKKKEISIKATFLKNHSQQQQQQQQNKKNKSKYIINPSTSDIKIAQNPLSLAELSGTKNLYKNKQQMASKIDVKIKISSNVKVDDNNGGGGVGDGGGCTSSSTEETGDEIDAENKAAGNLEQKYNIDDVNNDNDGNDADVDGATGYTSDLQKQSSNENQEEVDNIELIFSSDDKELPQEDLVSISDYEPWQKSGQSGTPILVNFSNISSDQETTITTKTSKIAGSMQKKPISDYDLIDNNNNNNQQRRTIAATAEQLQNTGDNDGFYNATVEAFNQQFTSKQFSLESYDSTGDNNINNNNNNNNGKNSTDDSNTIKMINDKNNHDSFYSIKTAASTIRRKWTNYNVIETDISKCGISDDNILDMGRRNTCPTTIEYRPIIHREALTNQLSLGAPVGGGGGGGGGGGAAAAAVTVGPHKCSLLSASNNVRCPLGTKFFRNANKTIQSTNASINSSKMQRPILHEDANIDDSGVCGKKRSSSAQTDISALPEHWRSESHLAQDNYGGNGFFTLPSKFVAPIPSDRIHYCRNPLRISDKTQEARRILLSDINFTSMVPELSRSADHLCRGGDNSNIRNEMNGINLTEYYKGTTLKTPDCISRGITPSLSMTSPGVSQWTVYDNSLGTQTTQTESQYWSQRGDSFDSCKSYSMGLRYGDSTGGLNKQQRSRSVPSVRCAICKQNHGRGNLKTSESMQNYVPRVTFQEQHSTTNSNQNVRGSLPDLRNECTCTNKHYRSTSNSNPSAARHHGYNSSNDSRSILRIYGDSSGSTESLLDEADDFLKKSMENNILNNGTDSSSLDIGKHIKNRRRSENDIKNEYQPSKLSLPFLPKSPKCLKPGHLAKIIAKNGRIVIGRVKYIGPLARFNENIENDENYVGLELCTKMGDCDGTIDGRKFFDCAPHHGIFVPFKKIVMAWSA